MDIRKLDVSLTSPAVKEMLYQLLHNGGYLPDCLNDVKSLTNVFGSMTNTMGTLFGVYNKYGEFSGVFFMGDIIPGHEATFYSWFWRPCMTPEGVRFINGYLEHYAETMGLSRVVSRTPDEKGHGKLMRALGMTLEGRFKNAYKSGGRLHTLFQYRRLFSK